MSFANTPEIVGRIHEIEHIHRVSAVEIGGVSQPMDLFAYTNKVEPGDFANDKINPS